MKRLLKMLGVLTLTIVPATSVVACGGASVPVNPTDDVVDIKDLLNKAQAKISEEFGDLINDEKNLFYENEFGNVGQAFKNVLSGLPDNVETQITDADFISSFTERMRDEITKVASKLLEDQDLRVLFNGISKQNILKININNTKYSRAPFQWLPERGVNFGINDYNEKMISDFNITYWYKIAMDLNLELSYKDDKNQEQTKDVRQSYTSYFANKGANISSVVKIASSKVKETLNNQLIDIDLTKSEDVNNEARIAKAKTKILTLINNPELKIEESNLSDITKLSSINSHVYTAASQFYEAFNKSETASQKYLETYLEDQTSKNFNRNLDNWVVSLSQKEKQKITPTTEPNINAFGKISLNNWTISGLSLQRINLNFINIRTDQSNDEWVSSISVSLAKIFSLNGCIKDQFNIINTNKDLVMYMNRADFDTFKSENKSMSDVNDYFGDKIKQKAIAQRAILADTPFKVWLNGASSGDNDPTLDNSEYIEAVDANTLKVIKNPAKLYSYLWVEIDGLSFFFGSKRGSKRVGNNYLTFNNWIIKRASGPIWG